MRLKKEVQELKHMISGLQEVVLRERTLITICKEQISRLEKQNSTLFDRLAARSLPEFKTFVIPEEKGLEPEKYDPAQDEDNAGEIMNVA